MQFPLESWRYDDRPVPLELRNPDLYNKKGQIRNFEAYPETTEGDFFDLKTYKNDASREALYVQDLLITIHCYWIRETDIDGFRVDAVKHMGEEAISRFCSYIREYTYSLGKKNFFLFGELLGSEESYNHYMGPKTMISEGERALSYGLNSVLDFPLYYLLEDVIKGKTSPRQLLERYERLQNFALMRGDYGEYLVTFIDNHDQVGKSIKSRFGYNASAEEIIAGIGFLLCVMGTPCIYYGTEQGLNGYGDNNAVVRECLFSLHDENTNLLNEHSKIYKAISAIAGIRKRSNVLKFGRMYFRETSSDGITFHFPECEKCVLAFSRVLFKDEILFIYNSSPCERKMEFISVDSRINKNKKWLIPLYGYDKPLEILTGKDGSRKRFISLTLRSKQVVIFKTTK